MVLSGRTALGKRIEVVKNCRNVGKHDMKFNGATPEMSVDPELFVSALTLHPPPVMN